MADSTFMSNPHDWAAAHQGFPTHQPSTPHPWRDDVEAFAYYASFGLLDPKMPLEAFAWRRALGMTGVRGLLAGAAISSGVGMAVAGIVGYAFDPADRREGGIVENRHWLFFFGPGTPPSDAWNYTMRKAQEAWELRGSGWD